MNESLLQRIERKLAALSDERGYQVLDYVEFLESKYAEKPAQAVNVLQGFADGVADKLRAGGLAVGTVSEAMGFLNKAVGVFSNVAQTTKNVATDAASVAKSVVDQIGAPTSGAATPGATTPGAAGAAAPTTPPDASGPTPPAAPPAPPAA